MSLMEQIRHDISKLEGRGLGSLTDVQLLTNLLLCEKCLLERNNEEQKMESVPVVLEHNHTYDRDINALYEGYMKAREKYEKSNQEADRGIMVDAMTDLLSEMSDLVCVLYQSAIFEEERRILSKFIEKTRSSCELTS